MSNTNSLRFSIITVCFNAEDAIASTIESVLNQSYPAFEYLIIDGNSKDNTVSIAESFNQKFTDKGILFKVISEPDTGIYNAMNKGLKRVTGDFISFLNAGDTYLSDALSKVNAFYNESPFELTYGSLNYINPNGEITVKTSKIDKYLITSRHWNHPSMFLVRDIYQQYGFDERFRTYADFHLYTKLRKTDIKIRVIPEIITNFRADGVSTDVSFKKVLARAGEKYSIYRDNHYSRLYWFESYGWEIIKSLYFRIKS